MRPDYTTVTEMPGGRASSEQMTRMCTRYYFASKYCEGKDVLEVACGAGQGLGYLAKKARRVVGGDCTENMVKYAKEYYQERVEVQFLDAHELPFENNSFDVVILFEAIYYLTQPEKFLDECRRVLREDGVVLICLPNKDWSGFNPSPFSIGYFSAPELYSLLDQKNFNVELLGDCPVSTNSFKDRLVSIIRSIAVSLHLIPKTMKGKEFLKRIFFGKLQTMEGEIIDGVVEYCEPVLIPCDSPNFDYKVLFAIARVRHDT